ncbi:sialic acid-binding Ig-like lectin 16 [Syngnathus acus]|uniref:sialic acid-binding Ig-like lectin 16 n=1 Tax=Syngnathus acus TaxID=161584 RepID=UPI0018860285|nr:sialic acid-binding Ig-like lectin 16 [Syngnathus acus]XP_037128829.1 sialic acid-binding Ig-like lectin 16 [Syngnathus acus]
MFFLTWAALFFHVSDYTAAVASHSDDFCEKGFCISLSKSQIVSEVGLCVVIPCSFSSASDFTPHSLVWFKCPQSKSRCSDTEIIFHSKNSGKIQEHFRGRVGMLEPDVRRRNCSIVINDLTFSDSGSYQLRVNGFVSSNPDGFTFRRRVSVTVTRLRKPTVLLPKMTAGQAATLTCVAPGLCSAAFIPTINWAWSGATDNDTRPDPDLGMSAQRYYSTLTFNATAEHHGRGVTCAVSFWRVNVTTEMTVTLNVSYAKLPSILGQTTLKRGDTLSLLCNADSFPPSSITWNYSNVTNAPLGSQLKPSLASAALVIPNVTAAHSGRYECVATNRTVHVDVTVTWFAGIVNGSGCWLRGQLLTCVCISGGVPPPTIAWPSLANRTVCGAVTAVSDDSVNSSVTLIGDHLNISAVECVSVHKDGEDRKILKLQITLEQEDQGMKTLVSMLRPDVFVAFFSGALVSALLCWLARTCCSKAKKSPGGRLDLEPLASQQYNLKNVGCEEDSKADVAYASINFSAMRRNDTRKVTTNHQGTEYAMIKTKEDADQLLERNDDNEEEGIMVEDGTQCISDKQERDENEEALYSNVG